MIKSAAGLDLSLTNSGVAVWDWENGNQTFLLGRPGITNASLADQIVAIDELATRICQATMWNGEWPEIVAVEALDNARAYGGVTERTALYWQVVSRLREAGCRIWVPTSAQVKIYAAGNGLATKKQVIAGVTEHWPNWHHHNNDNVADAAALCELGLALADQPSKLLPEEHTRVLPRVRRITDPPGRVTAAATLADTLKEKRRGK